MKKVKCPKCGKEVIIPEVLIRKTGLLRCVCGKIFSYK
jgi:ribosomal protein S27AE